MAKNFSRRCNIPVEECREELRKILRDNKGKPCPYCTLPLSVSTISPDHIVPLSRGGSPSFENVQATCRTCNSAKGSMTAEEYGGLVRYLQEKGIDHLVIPRLKMANLVYNFKFWKKK